MNEGRSQGTTNTTQATRQVLSLTVAEKADREEKNDKGC